jgi:putative RecB family exonuclease
VHAVLERLFDLPAAERTSGAASAMVDGAWARLREDEPELAALFDDAAGGAADEAADEAVGAPGAEGEEQVWLRSAHELLGRYFELEDPTRLEPAERELYVEAQLESGLVLRGYVDRLDVSPAGDLRVVDYKTGRAPGQGFEAKAMFQMRFYALVLWRLRGTVPRLLQLMYLGDGQVLRHAPTEDELRATERKLHALWQAVQRATETGDWRPRRSKLCAWCPHQALCPEFGGTPPPLPVAPAAVRQAPAEEPLVLAPG